MTKSMIAITSMLCGIIVLLIITRMFYGADVLDEAYYYAMTYRFVLGDGPFIDETAIHQTASLIILPIVAVFYKLTGGISGIILFMRLFFLVIASGVSYLVYRAIKNTTLIPIYSASLISMLCLLYVPANVFALSYNNIATLSLTATLFLLFGESQPTKKSNLIYFAAGVLLSLSVIAYPTMILFLICYLFFIIPLKKNVLTKNNCLFFVLGLAMPIAIVFVYFLAIGLKPIIQNFLSSLKYGPHLHFAFQDEIIKKIISIFSSIWGTTPYHPFIVKYSLFSIITFRIFRKKIPGLIFLCIPLVLIPFVEPYTDPCSRLMHFVIVCGFILPYLMFFTENNDSLPKRVFWYLWMPAIISGIITSYSSINGYINFSVGFFPAVLATQILLTHLITTSSINYKKSMHLCGLFINILFVTFFMHAIYDFVYNDAKISSLNARVESGPFKFLMTTTSKKDFFGKISATFKTYNKENSRVLIYDYFPAGYLFTSHPPASNSVWQTSPEVYGIPRDILITYLTQPHHMPSLILQMKQIPIMGAGGTLGMNYKQDDLITLLIKREYEKVEENNWYVVYNKRVVSNIS